MTTFNDLATFAVCLATPAPTSAVLQTFFQLPDDSFLHGQFAFRKRVFARGILSPDGIEWDSGTDFFQPRAINEYAGGIKRVFAPAGDMIRDYIWEVLQSPFYRSGLGDGRYHFGLHQIRIICDDRHEGHPVPEGYHQDGFDFVAIHSFQRFNVKGGMSSLRDGTKDGPCLFERDLVQGEILLFNDRRLFHYASPVTIAEPGIGHRDICVLTFSKIG
ncbi:MAG TPA: 2OG-Fe dioxygenase family protein [Chthoniobacterales bacterium]|jgi:hypothetical protein|nr:2OG-Fe dioxygenase family protein [Chthoniobacterales bacterium]